MRTLTRLACLAAGLTLSACAPANDPQSEMVSRQEQALHHPFDYTPGHEIPDISPGGVGDYDQKALGKDLHDFLNP